MGPASRRAAVFAPQAMAAYCSRFAGSWLVLVRAGAACFDPHTFGLLGDAILLLALLPVMAGLLWWVLRRRRPWRGVFAGASAPGWTVLSVLALLLVGMPTPEQAWALILLPLRDAWPVLASALLWFAVAAVGRALAVAAPGTALRQRSSSGSGGQIG